MNVSHVQHFIVAFALVAVLLPGVCCSEDAYLKEMPKEGEIPYGKVVYVDDSKCREGEVKEVTGGSRENSIPRKVRYVKRPDRVPRM